MKKLFSLLLLFTLSFALVGCEEAEDDGLQYSEFEHLYNYSQVLTQSEDEYFVYFYATWCSVCSKVKDDILPFTFSNTNEVKVYLIDIDHLTGENFIEGFEGVPTLVTIVDGVLVDLNVGETNIRITLNDTNAGIYDFFE